MAIIDDDVYVLLHRQMDGIIAIHPTGSRYIENPKKLSTDDDYLVLVKDQADEEEKLYDAVGWVCCDYANSSNSPEQQEGDSWSAWRYDELNIIITDDSAYFVKCMAATELCKAFNVKEKDQRIALFRTVKFATDSKTSTGVRTIVDQWIKDNV